MEERTMNVAYFTYGAIVVGSQEVSLKIYEISPKIGIHQVDYVNQYFDISKDAYSKGKLGVDQVEAICQILLKFKEKLAEYGVKEVYES